MGRKSLFLIIAYLFIIMLARLVFRQLCRFSQANAQAELNLYKPHLKKYFEGDVSKVEKEGNLLAKKYDLKKEGIQKLFKMNPEVFIPGSQARQLVDNKIKFLNKREKTAPVAGVFNEFLFDSTHLLLEMNHRDMDDIIRKLKDFGFTQEKAINVLSSCSNIIHNKFDVVYQEKLDILQDYLHFSKEEAVDLFVKEPFLLTCSTKRFRESVVFFVERKSSMLTQKKIAKLLQEVGQIFLMGRVELIDLYRKYKSWGFHKDHLWSILLEHPLLLLNHPGEIMHFKLKMMRKFDFTLPMGRQLLKKHQAALICSVSALEAKFLLARDRLKIKLDYNNLEYLTFKFGANIRPRAEMLIRAKIPYTSEDIVDYLRCSEEEFLKKTGVPGNKLREEKFRFAVTAELDIPNKRCLRNYPTEEKIIELSKRYYPKEDCILSQAS